MKQKTVFITGASRGIGAACARRFAKASYHVFINCKQSVGILHDLRDELRENGGSCDALIGDVGDPDQVEAMFSTIRQTVGGLDVLVNNAGIAWLGLLTDMTNADWDRMIGTNLSSAFYCSRAAIPYMVSQKQGRIINISSMWGRTGASCEAAYSAAKAGLNGLTMALAKELAPSNIQVNAVACGVIDTDMNGCLSEEDKYSLQEEIPAGRFGTPEETADLVFDLAENHPYMTGQILGFDGGFI